MPSKDIKEIVAKNDYLKGQDGDKLSYYQDVANFCLPRKAWITSIKIYGEQLKFNYLYDTRAILAVKESACGFASKLTSPVAKWFDFRTIDQKLMQSGNVQKYFKEVSDIQYGINNDSNWNETILENYTDDLVFGTSPILTEEDHKEHVRYTSIPVEQVSFERDDRGEICGVFRRFKFTALQVSKKFPRSIPKIVQDCLNEEKYYEKFDILHYVGERHDRDVSKKDGVNMEYRSIWILLKEQHLLGEGGFTSNPYAVMEFWRQCGDNMAYSPAMDVLASIKLANAQKRTLIRRAMKDADQATASPARFWLGRMSQNPAAMNQYDKTKYSKEDFFPIPTGGNPQLGAEMMQIEQEIIDRGFFLTLFKAMTSLSKDMNVPETHQRISESIELIAPVVGRMTKTIGKSQLRTYEILSSRGMFPPPPKEIQGKDLGVLFISPLARLQRASVVNNTMNWLQIVKVLQGIKPDATDGINVDKIITGSADLLNVDSEYVFEKNKIEDIRKKNMAIKQQQMQLQMAGQAAEIAKTGAEAGKAHAQGQKK